MQSTLGQQARDRWPREVFRRPIKGRRFASPGPSGWSNLQGLHARSNTRSTCTMEDRRLDILLVKDDELDVMNVRRPFTKNNSLIRCIPRPMGSKILVVVPGLKCSQGWS